MGAHPSAPSRLRGTGHQDDLRLTDYLAHHPETLGEPTETTGTLPFLLKVLAIDTPLSIQAHPTRDQAQEGFVAEESAGLALQAAERNYVDANHKPELVVALTGFSALCGFRPVHAALADVGTVRDLILAQAEDDDRSLSNALEALTLCLLREDLGAALSTALYQAAPELSRAATILAETDLRAHGLSAQLSDIVTRITSAFPGDPGVFVALMLNRVELEPGQALFMPAGNLHAYLHGVGLEVMANSDNVLRGGLTSKHVDVPELLRITDTAVLPKPSFEPETRSAHQTTYAPDVEEFELHRIDLPTSGLRHESQHPGPSIALCTAGTVHAETASHVRPTTETARQQTLTLSPGESVFIPAGEPAVFAGHSAQLFIAAAPQVSRGGEASS